jgi:hypothetical protein
MTQGTLPQLCRAPPGVGRIATGSALPYHTSVRGTSRKGKSEWLLSNVLLPSLRDSMRLTALIDPASDLCVKAVAWAIHLGYAPEDIVVDDIDDIFHVLPITLIGVSDHPDARVRSAENRQFRTEFIDIVGMSSHTEDIHSLQTVKELLNLVALVYQYQKEVIPQAFVHHILMPESPWFKRYYDNCTDKYARLRMGMIQGLWRAQNKSEYYRYVLPTLRRLEEILEDEAIKCRLHGKPYDLEPLIERGGFYGMKSTQGGPIGRTAQTFLIRNRNLEFGRIARRRKARKGVTTPADICVDEWKAVAAVHELEVVNLNTLLKLETQWCYSTQNDDIGEPLLNDSFQQACTRQITFFCSGTEVVRRAAESMVTAIDFFKVKRQRERTRTKVVGFDKIPTTTKGRTVDHDGHRRTTESENVRYEPVNQDVTEYEDEFFDVREQLTQLEILVKSLQVGQYLEVFDGAVSGPLYQPMMTFRGDPQEYFDEQYQWLRENVLHAATSEPSDDDTPPAVPTPSPPPPPPARGNGRSRSTKGKRSTT